MPRPRKITKRGPQTPAGIARIRAANTTHGIFSREVLLECESAEDLDAFTAGLYRRFEPDDDYECMLVDRVVDTAWRLARGRRAETALANNLYIETRGWHEGKGEVEDEEFHMLLHRICLTRIAIHPEMEKLLRYETAVERQYYKALNQLERVQRTRQGDQVAPPAALDITVSEGPALELPVS